MDETQTPDQRPSEADCFPHDGHDAHAHGQDCGHLALEHEGHVDYMHDTHRHAEHGGHWDEHPAVPAMTGTSVERPGGVG